MTVVVVIVVVEVPERDNNDQINVRRFFREHGEEGESEWELSF
jgi:hypothetical protein